MTTNYDLSKIRTLLTEGFSDAELRRFCYDTPDFRAAYDGLAANTGKAEIIDRLLEFAKRRELFDPLLARVKPNRMTITTPIHLELVRIPAGEFLMGSDPAKDKNAMEVEQPQHCVYLSEFYIAKYPVTNEQYAVFVREMKHQEPGHWEKGEIPAGKENHPVVNVSWDDAAAFCRWLSQTSGRACCLPTEAEWEKAARGTDGRIYPWGNQWDKSKLNSREGGLGDTTPVGKYSPGGDSPYGVTDMVGNVWEWCNTIWQEKAYPFKVQNEWVEWVEACLNRRHINRAVRGGAFSLAADDVRCAVRLGDDPYDWYYVLGFRVILPPSS